ncbi:MAG TPA: serine hydrolase domain-containing protein [Polyangiaceae bacterium]|jgi:CubicO group peptidase (beta-lactamase class C family)|nr:serine hydrolase domain-containing protein [Polyangiaceae bacterium]
MSADRLENLAQTMLVAPGVTPAAVLSVGGRSGSGWRFATGAFGTRSTQRPARVDPKTPFDLASVTKPVVASTIARLVRRGLFGFQTPLEVLLPALRGTATGPLPLELLLAHRAGLDAHRALYAELAAGGSVDPDAMLVAAAEARRDDCAGSPPDEGFPPLYSDMGYLLAGAAVARACGEPLERIVARETSDALGIDVASSNDWRARDATFDDTVAPTEIVPWRGGELVGDVHDENAWAYSRRGTAGHAGLFGTAEHVARFGAAFLDALAGRDTAWLTPGEASVLTRPRPLGTLRAGFDGRSSAGSAAGSAFGTHSFGHLGFTGTSLWCDPDASIVAVILTNRVNPTRDNIAIRSVRPRLHDALFTLAVNLGRT